MSKHHFIATAGSAFAIPVFEDVTHALTPLVKGGPENLCLKAVPTEIFYYFSTIFDVVVKDPIYPQFIVLVII